MALARRLTAGALLLLAVSGASAVETCEEGRLRTGLALEAVGGRLVVAGVAAGSQAARRGVRDGDTVLQVNGVAPGSCRAWVGAVEDARRAGVALLLLLGRGDGQIVLALPASTGKAAEPARDTSVAEAVVPAPAPAEAPSMAAIVAAAPPPALARADREVLAATLRRVEALAREAAPPASLVAYRDAVVAARAEIDALSATGLPAPGVESALALLLRYHEAAVVAWESEEALRERDRRPRRYPMARAAAAPYLPGSAVAAAIAGFPFLEATVERPPGPGVLVGGRAGLWRPVEARALLWERARAEQAALAAWLAGPEPVP
jgi:hypothetical protein